MQFFLLTFCAIAIYSTLAQDLYYKVVGEQCSSLTNSTQWFDYLLGCGNYDNGVPVSYDCLDPTQYPIYLVTVPKWKFVQQSGDAVCDSIQRTFEFEDFYNAFTFMSQSAQLFQKNDHHPTWTNSYNTVDVTVCTDFIPCLTQYDFDLAQGMDRIYNTYWG